MKTVQRLINGKFVDVNVYNEMEYEAHIAQEEYDTAERRNMEHADRVASQLASNQGFINAIAKAVMNMEVK